jgi:hypothetical protein
MVCHIKRDTLMMSSSDGAFIPKQTRSFYRSQQEGKYENIFKENMIHNFSVEQIHTPPFDI